MKKIMEEIDSEIEKLNETADKEYPIAASTGSCSVVVDDKTLYEECLKKSDDEMYKVKLEHKKKAGYRGRE